MPSRIRFTSARAAERYLLGFVNYEILTGYRQTTQSHDLTLFRRVLLEAGWSAQAVPTVHVGGTNGKGTVSWLLERILRAGGLRTGLYQSPHLQSIRERIRIEGRPIGVRAFTKGVEHLAGRFAARPGAGFRTTFEHLTALSFLAFQEARVDLAVVEVGLGGRLDATNVLPPGPAVLTPISVDHAEILGRTVSTIARDKAAILKRGGHAFVMHQSPAARRVIEDRLRQIGVRATFTREACPARVVLAGPSGTLLHVRGVLDYGRVATKLLGDHQADNAGAAVSVAETLLPRESLRGAVRRGLSGARVPGRLEIIERAGRRFLVDGGHNPAASRAIARALACHFPGARIVAVVGMARDKDHRAFLEALAPGVRRFLFTRAKSPRSADPEMLRSCSPLSGDIAPSVSEALRRALSFPHDLILVAGSFVVAGEARRALGRGRTR